MLIKSIKTKCIQWNLGAFQIVLNVLRHSLALFVPKLHCVAVCPVSLPVLAKNIPCDQYIGESHHGAKLMIG